MAPARPHPLPPLPGPDPWAQQTATLPLAFAQVREDPRVDLALASVLPYEGSVVMVASGGDTALCLGWVPLQRLLLVDMNPAQLSLTRCKWRLAETHGSNEVSQLLGHHSLPPEERGRQWTRLLESLGMQEDALGPPELIAELGPDHAGRYEVTFAELRLVLADAGCQEDLRFLLHSDDPEVAAPLLSPDRPLGRALDAALASVMSLQNLVCLFGAQATQNPRQPFHRHFAERIRDVVARLSACTNPFLWQMLAGTFPDTVSYDWIQNCSGQSAFRTEPDYERGRMAEVLDSLKPGSVDLVHLSNILDWLSVEEATATSQSVRRVLKPGGRVIIRQLNSTLAMTELDCGLVWDMALGRELQDRDRSFFYPQIHVGVRR